MREWLRGFLMILGAAAILSSLVIAAQHTIDLIIELWGLGDPSPVAKQLFVSFLGLAMFGIILAMAVRVLQKKHQAFSERVIEVIQHLGRGDYSVELPLAAPQGPLGDFVSNIKSMASDLRAMEKLRQEFISNVSHDLQSPLTSMRGFGVTPI